jgi:hypothetical protein
MINPPTASHAALTQDSEQHLPNLFHADRTLLNQADHPSHMLDQLRILRRRQSLGYLGGAWCTRGRWCAWGFGRLRIQQLNLSTTPLILPSLVLPPLLALVILRAAPDRFSAPVLLLAPKGTAQVMAPGIPGVREKENPAMPATAQAFAQVRLGPQDRSQEHVILQNQRPDAPLPVPSGPELKKLRDPDCKKPKPSLRLLTLNSRSSSYWIAASGVEKVGRGFFFPILHSPSPERKMPAQPRSTVARFT